MIRHRIRRLSSRPGYGREFWASRDTETAQNPIDNYIDLQPSSHITLGILHYYANKDDHIVEIGCNVGRHLQELEQQGFTNLTGNELNENCKDKQLFDDIVFSPALDFLRSLDDADVIFTHGNVINFLDNRCYRAMAKTAKKYIILTNERFTPLRARLRFRFDGFRRVFKCVYDTDRCCYVYENRRGK